MPLRGAKVKDDAEVTEYFSDRVGDYARFRPGYAAEAVAFVLGGLPAPVQAVDVGCGTGIMSRQLRAAGAAVTGVEPSGPMRAAAAEASPDDPQLVFRAGTAEATGLEPGVADLVVVAQAFHWFDAAAALVEFQRVLRPGGRLALVWNVRDDERGFGALYAEVVRRAKADAATRGRVVRHQRSGDPQVGGRFRTTVDKRPFDNPQSLTWEELLGRSTSASYFPPPGALREELFEVLRAGFAEHQRDGRVVMPQATQVTLAERVDG